MMTLVSQSLDSALIKITTLDQAQKMIIKGTLVFENQKPNGIKNLTIQIKEHPNKIRKDALTYFHSFKLTIKNYLIKPYS